MKEVSVLDYVKSQLGFGAGSRQPSGDRNTRKVGKAAKKMPLISRVRPLVVNPAALLISLLLLAYVLARLPRMPGDADYSLLFAFWVLAILGYVFAFVRYPKINVPRAPKLRGEPLAVLLILAGAILLGLSLRLWNLGTIPFVLSGDEASQGLEAVSVVNGEIRNPFSTGWYSVPTMVFFLFSLPIRFFGQTAFAIRLPAAILGALTIPLVFLLVRHLTKGMDAKRDPVCVSMPQPLKSTEE
jgi:hypothetical protein